jgi:hypothetical protein
MDAEGGLEVVVLSSSRFGRFESNCINISISRNSLLVEPFWASKINW